MAQRFETDGGTAFVGPLQIIDEDGEILASIGGAAAAVAVLTDSSGGTAGATLAAQSVALTGVDGSGDNAAPLAGVNTQLGIIRNSIASLAAKVNALIAATGLDDL
jgi:hypothetical protein